MHNDTRRYVPGTGIDTPLEYDIYTRTNNDLSPSMDKKVKTFRDFRVLITDYYSICNPERNKYRTSA